MGLRISQDDRALIQDACWRMLYLGGRQGATFLSFLIAAHLLTPYAFGAYSYLLASAFLVVILVDFGISNASAATAAQTAVQDPDQAHAVLASAMTIVIPWGVIAAVLFAVLGPWALGSDPVDTRILAGVIVLAPLSAVGEEVYRGLRRFRLAALIALSTGGTGLVLGYVFIRMWGTSGAAAFQVVFFGMMAAALLAGYRSLALPPRRDVVVRVARYALIIGIANAGYFLYTKADVLVLKWFGHVVEIGYYEFATRIAGILILPCAIIGQVMAPRTAARATDGDWAGIRRALFRGTWIAAGSGVVLALAAYPAARLLIREFFPAYYVPALLKSLALLLLLLPLKCWGAFLDQGFIVPSGRARILAVTTAAGGVVNVALDFLFIAWLGYMGVIWSTLLVHSLVMTANGVWFLRMRTTGEDR